MSIEAMKQALEALKDERDKYLEYSTEDGAPEYIYEAIRSLEFEVAKQTFEEPVQKPFAWCIESEDSADWCFASTEEGVKINSVLMDEDCIKTNPFPLYTTPQERLMKMPKQEPVLWMMPDGKTADKWALQFYGGQKGKPLYTTPQPQREWVGLTDEEKAQFVVAYYPSNWDRKTAVSLMNDYEKYLKEKNHV